jgi:hypothetical protein
VREYLVRLADQDDRAAKARAEIAELAKRSTMELGPNWKWNRDDLYDRSSLRRFEHPAVRSVKRPVRKAKKSKSA